MPESAMPEASDPRPQPPVPTGDSAVDSLLEELSALDYTPVSTHGAMYADLHEGLLAALNADGNTPPDAPVPGPAKDAR